jgi:microcystin-dependent protein
MAKFADCSTNVGDLTAAQFCQGFGGCGDGGLAATSANLNAVIGQVSEEAEDAVAALIARIVALEAGGTVGVPLRVPLAWYPAGANDPVPVGFNICDGTNGTPDLTAEFLIAEGVGFVFGSTGGSLNHNHGPTGNGGAHDHTGTTAAHALTISQIPAHSHSLVSPGVSNNNIGAGGIAQQRTAGGDTEYVLMGNNGAASLGDSSIIGGDQPHSHLIPAVADHTHATANASNVPPHHVIKAWIMRI